MCLGIPGRVDDTFHEDGLLMGTVDFGGVRKRVCLEHVPDAVPGQYVLVHVGFALARLDEGEAARVFEFLAAIGQLDELGVGQESEPRDAAQEPDGEPQAGRHE